MLPKGSFVLGGAASGKSVWAEGLVQSSGLRMVYLATGRILDADVQERVNTHRARRVDRWYTVEEPLELSGTLTSLTSSDIVLIDCATMWLTNHLLAGHDLIAAQENLIAGLTDCAAPWVTVSNEVGQGIVPDNALSRQFREAQGRLNIALAAQANLVVQVIAGIPRVLKGALP